MKIILLILMAFYCNLIFSQTINHRITDEKTGNEMLIGNCNRQAFLQSPFNEWYDVEYKTYQPNQEIIKQLSLLVNEGLHIIIVFGSWCGDSKEQVPRFLTIADQLAIDPDMIEFIAVDRKKQAPNMNIDEYKIEKVPTFIFYKNGKECGRIIETPETTLENDMLNLLKK
ncbi:MAG: thioredoxin family protein [Bacteroidales bacterium]|nr:thioredoxin family protein [Bacteroidales bacterium]